MLSDRLLGIGLYVMVIVGGKLLHAMRLHGLQESLLREGRLSQAMAMCNPGKRLMHCAKHCHVCTQLSGSKPTLANLHKPAISAKQLATLHCEQTDT